MIHRCRTPDDKRSQLARLDRQNRAKFWCDRKILGLGLLHAAFTSHDYGPHTHEAFVIAATEAGGAHIKSRNATEPVSPGTLFVSNPEEAQSSWMGDSECWRYRSIYLGSPAITSITQALSVETLPCFGHSLIGDGDLITNFLRLHVALEDGEDDERTHELLIGVLGKLFRRHGSDGRRIAAGPRDLALARQIVDVMRARCTEKLHLADLASRFGLTIFQMIGLFKRTVGMTPHVFLIRLRLNLACRCLRRDLPLAEAALEAGFCDQSALTKYFKRCYGITPLQYATAVRAAR